MIFPSAEYPKKSADILSTLSHAQHTVFAVAVPFIVLFIFPFLSLWKLRNAAEQMFRTLYPLLALDFLHGAELRNKFAQTLYAREIYFFIIYFFSPIGVCVRVPQFRGALKKPCNPRGSRRSRRGTSSFFCSAAFRVLLEWRCFVAKIVIKHRGWQFHGHAFCSESADSLAYRGGSTSRADQPFRFQVAEKCGS